MRECIFCRIIRKDIPSTGVYEDADIFAFYDINPVAPVHLLLIPKLHIISLAEIEEKHHALLGKIMVLIPRLAKKEGCADGFRTIINTGYVGGQEVDHLHIHIIGGGKERLPAMIHRPN
ncbi:MAG: histidine triad nucleotide-binding protein [Nitrosospira sp.]|nr:histidine triad nucleotide-binding protein [Nitrosospira sp.]